MFWRLGTAAAVAVLLVVACGGGELSSPQSTDPKESRVASPSLSLTTVGSQAPATGSTASGSATALEPAATTPPTGTAATTTETPSTSVAPPATEPPDGAGPSFIVIDGEGVHRDGVLAVAGAITWADDDEMGGIVYRPAGEDVTIRWLPAGADQPIDTGLLRGLVGTTGTWPVLVTSNDEPVDDECGEDLNDSDYYVDTVNARSLDLDRATGTGAPQLLTCNFESVDSGYLTLSYRNGHLLQVLTQAAAWMYTDYELLLVGPGDVQIDLPANTFAPVMPGWEQLRELDAVLSPDAASISVRQRLDNRYSNGPNPDTGEVDVEEWERLTAAIPSTIRVVDLGTGTVRYETQVPYGVELGDFDGRHLALVDGSQSTIVDTLGATAPTTLSGVVVFIRASDESQPAILPEATPPTVRQGDAGPWVSHLQLRLLVHDPSAGLAVDGQFGPATLAAVMAFQRSYGLEADGTVGPNTWAALMSEPQ